MLVSYNQLQKYLRHCTVFWHKWPVHDLVLVIPPPPLIKVASNTRPYSKLGGTTLNGREEGGQYYILQTCDQERFEARKVVFPWECLIIFVTGCLSPSYSYSRGARLLNGVKRGALLAPKEVVIKNSISFLSVCLFKNGETKTAVVGPLVYVVICKKLGFERKHVAKDATPS